MTTKQEGGAKAPAKKKRKVDPTYAAQNRYTAKMKEKGFTRLTVWVHTNDLDTVADFATEMREARERPE